jgi:hypothetical protein
LIVVVVVVVRVESYLNLIELRSIREWRQHSHSNHTRQRTSTSSRILHLEYMSDRWIGKNRCSKVADLTNCHPTSNRTSTNSALGCLDQVRALSIGSEEAAVITTERNVRHGLGRAELHVCNGLVDWCWHWESDGITIDSVVQSCVVGSSDGVGKIAGRGHSSGLDQTNLRSNIGSSSDYKSRSNQPETETEREGEGEGEREGGRELAERALTG